MSARFLTSPTAWPSGVSAGQIMPHCANEKQGVSRVDDSLCVKGDCDSSESVLLVCRAACGRFLTSTRGREEAVRDADRKCFAGSKKWGVPERVTAPMPGCSSTQLLWPRCADRWRKAGGCRRPDLGIVQLAGLGQLALAPDGGVDAPQVGQGRRKGQPVQHLHQAQRSVDFIPSASAGPDLLSHPRASQLIAQVQILLSAWPG